MCEHSAVSSAASLREARRKKILENSANRLKLIEKINSSVQKYYDEKCPESTAKPKMKTSEQPLTSTENSKTKAKLSEVLIENDELQQISDFILRGEKNLDENGEEEAEVITFQQKRGKSLLESFLEKKLHYILLALVVNLMLLFNVGHLFYENVFCPFYTAKLVEILSKREQEQLQPVILLFIASLPKKVQSFTKVILSVLSILLSDLCLYLFTFVVGNKIATSLG